MAGLILARTRARTAQWVGPSGFWAGGGGGTGGGGGIPCPGKCDSTNSGATKSVPFLKNEQTNYVWFPVIAHEK